MTMTSEMVTSISLFWDMCDRVMQAFYVLPEEGGGGAMKDTAT